MKDNMKMVKGLIVLLIMAFVLACSSSPQDRIVGRWEVIPPAHHGYDDHVQMEFLKDGTLNAYINGKVEISGTRYIMASDGKSMIFEDPSTQRTNLIIEELTPKSLVLVEVGRMRIDTVRMKRL